MQLTRFVGYRTEMTTSLSLDVKRMAAWRQFLAAHSGIISVMAKELEEEVDLPLAWYEVLLYLRESDEGRLRMHELADSLLLSRSAVTRFVDRMEKSGLVCRRECDSDGRGIFVTLTEEGSQKFDEAAPIHLRGISDHFARCLSEDEAEMMSAVLSRVIARLPSRAPSAD